MNLNCQLPPPTDGGDDLIPCRRLLVDGPPGEAVEVEVLPHGGLEYIGVIDSTLVPVAAALPRRVTVTKGQVWIVGSPGPITLRASTR